MKYFLIVCAAVVVVPACAPMPENRDEFIHAIESRGRTDLITVENINQPISVVNRNLAHLSNKCLNSQVTKSGMVRSASGNVSGSSVTVNYFSNIEAKKSDGGSQLTVKSKPKGLIIGTGGKPIFVITADASPLSKNKTKLKMYNSIGYDHFVGIVKEAADGNTKSCPNLAEYH